MRPIPLVPLTEDQRQYVYANKGLAKQIVINMWKYPLVRKIGSMDDVFQDSMVAMCRCITRPTYDPSKSKFSTYSHYAMWREIWSRAFHGGLVHIAHGAFKGKDRKLAHNATNISNYRTNDSVSFSVTYDDRGILDRRLDIVKALSDLDSRARRILTWCYGLDGEPEMSLGWIAEQEGVTKERIRQLRNKALAKLRRSYPELEESI